jgi:hypothetical protein
MDASLGGSRRVAVSSGLRFTDKDEHMYFWFPLLAGLSELTFDPRADIRYFLLRCQMHGWCNASMPVISSWQWLLICLATTALCQPEAKVLGVRVGHTFRCSVTETVQKCFKSTHCRYSALEVLFDTLTYHGSAFTPEFWTRIFDSVLLSIFDHVRAEVRLGIAPVVLHSMLCSLMTSCSCTGRGGAGVKWDAARQHACHWQHMRCAGDRHDDVHGRGAAGGGGRLAVRHLHPVPAAHGGPGGAVLPRRADAAAPHPGPAGRLHPVSI